LEYPQKHINLGDISHSGRKKSRGIFSICRIDVLVECTGSKKECVLGVRVLRVRVLRVDTPP